MAIFYEDAYSKLGTDDYKTVDALVNLVKDVSGTVKNATSGSTHLLFSGKMLDGSTYTSSVVAEILDNNTGNVYSVTNSDVGKLVNNSLFQSELGFAITRDVLNGSDDLSTATQFQKDEIKRKFQEILNGKDANGKHINTDSLWDIASKNYTAAAEGNFRIIAPQKLDDLSVFVQSELPALLENTKVTTIDGIARTDLLALRDAKGMEAVKASIVANSLTQVHVSGLAVNNFDAYLKLTPDGVAAEFANPDKIQAFNAMLDSMPEEQKAYYKSGVSSMVDGAEHATLNGVAKGLNKLGVVGGVLGFMFAANDAAAAELAGNSHQAKEIMKLWAVDTAGSELASVVGVAVGGIAVAALGVAGVALSAPLAGAMVFGAALVGGYFGGDLATDLYHWLNDSSVSFADLGSGLLVPHLALELTEIFISELQSLFYQAEIATSPLIVDLEGDGIETLSKAAGIHFDHDGNRFAETTGWVGKDDGLLVWDRNGNGKIDNGGELFGNHTLLADGTSAPNGFAALADLDSNNDGKFDQTDTVFSQLGVWRDLNSDAVATDGELLSLDAAGVQSLSLAYTTQSAVDEQGNQHLQVGQYTRTDGTTRTLTDVWFAADHARAVAQDLLPLDQAIAALPDLQGFGNVHSLHQAMARDASGELKASLEGFLEAPDKASRLSLLDQILFKWTNSDQYTEDSRGSHIDGRKLYVLEAFLGESFFQEDAGSDPMANAAQRLNAAYAILAEHVYGSLITQTSQVQGLYDQLTLVWKPEINSFEFDIGGVVSQLRTVYADSVTFGRETLDDFRLSLSIKGEVGQALIQQLVQQGSLFSSGLDFDLAILAHREIIGSGGYDTLYGQEGESNYLAAYEGRDKAIGADMDDILNGGSGEDWLEGRAGDDTYLFRPGDGADRIVEAAGVAAGYDALKLGPGIEAAGTQVYREGNELALVFTGSDSVRIGNYFNERSLETISFADGTSWDYATAASRASYNGTDSRDHLYGLSGVSNRINGLGWHDNLYGADKADVLAGGTGNDWLEGGDGNDTYLFNLGDGADRIVESSDTVTSSDVLKLGTGISPATTQVLREGTDIALVFNNNDSVRMSSYLNQKKVETVTFSDGTIWDFEKVASLAIYAGTSSRDYLYGLNGITNQIKGLDWHDYLYGADKDDVLDGGAGIDYLEGGGGNDIIQGGMGADSLKDLTGKNLFNGGADNDALSGGGGSELFIGGSGDDVISTGAGQDIIAFNKGDGRDTVLASTGGDNTLSLGSGVAYADMTFSKAGKDLILKTGATDQITFKDWYASENSKTIGNLQMVIEGGSNYDPASANSLHNRKVAQFNFNGLAQEFDQALAATPTLTSWSLSASLMDFHLASSDTEALGGDLTYHYAKYGALSSMTVTPALAVLSHTDFGAVSQALQPSAALQDHSLWLL